MPSASTQSPPVVLPGIEIPAHYLPIPSNPNQSLKLGPGLVHIPPSTITPTFAGTVHKDVKKHAVWVESSSGRHAPSPGDIVLATVLRSSSEAFVLSLAPYSPPVFLGHLSFENVSKKTRPQLAPGALVYARVLSASKHIDTELTCVNPATGKGEGMGELKGGTVFNVSLGMARRLLMKKQREEGGVSVLELLAEKMAFEVAVGRNGRVWVDAEGGVRETLAVGRALVETDEGVLDGEGQRKLVRRLLAELGKG